MIQRPRNRQNRQRTEANSSRGRPKSTTPASSRTQSSGSVPTVAQVVAGAHVSIVLKIDQPTGRQVQGTVAEVLTSGNHPRGIKVRLVDGRVGRVQRIVTKSEAEAGSAGLANLGRNGEPESSAPSRTVRTPMILEPAYRDYREEEAERRPAGFMLADLLPPDVDDLPHSAPSVETHVCPVCNDFEGDETAVAHHVSTHFD